MELEELKNILKELGLLNGKQEKRVRRHETKAQYLTIAYVICQGLIFNSITHQYSYSNQCQNWWIPFSISLLCSLIYFMAFLDAVSMFYRTQYQLDLNYAEQQLIHLQIHEAKSHKIQIGELEISDKQRWSCYLLVARFCAPEKSIQVVGESSSILPFRHRLLVKTIISSYLSTTQ
ncbi:conserved hypothetical protein [Ricinus communis]|uniref:Uncharacterized protein n=1 Tax=Ricinus communis TaxID=3988 RepID=B9RIP9_RICCO|nr:conserved hypothetical protein [Ricinus communis]